jgi:hypothetical protein
MPIAAIPFGQLVVAVATKWMEEDDKSPRGFDTCTLPRMPFIPSFPFFNSGTCAAASTIAQPAKRDANTKVKSDLIRCTPVKSLETLRSDRASGEEQQVKYGRVEAVALDNERR